MGVGCQGCPIHTIRNYLPEYSKNLNISIGFGKFPVINSQEVQIGRFLTGQGRREDRGGIGTGIEINSNQLQIGMTVSVSVNFRLISSEK